MFKKNKHKDLSLFCGFKKIKGTITLRTIDGQIIKRKIEKISEPPSEWVETKTHYYYYNSYDNVMIYLPKNSINLFN